MRRWSRRRWRNQATVSLFSFIDVIGGLIGALSLIIISISLSHVVPESSSASPLDSRKRLLETQIQQKNSQINSMRKTISEINMQKADIQKAGLRLGILQQAFYRMAARQSNVAEVLEEKQTLHKRIRELETELNRLQIDIVSLNKAADEKKGKTIRDKIEVHFTGRGRNLEPTFVECTAKGLLIQDKEIKETINNRIISTSDKFHLLLEQVKERTGGTVIFLIRPDGISSFNLAMARAKEYNVRAGKLPVPGSGEIDLSHYKE